MTDPLKDQVTSRSPSLSGRGNEQGRTVEEPRCTYMSVGNTGRQNRCSDLHISYKQYLLNENISMLNV